MKVLIAAVLIALVACREIPGPQGVQGVQGNAGPRGLTGLTAKAIRIQGVYNG